MPDDRQRPLEISPIGISSQFGAVRQVGRFRTETDMDREPSLTGSVENDSKRGIRCWSHSPY
jgi:hypothetical protein